MLSLPLTVVWLLIEMCFCCVLCCVLWRARQSTILLRLITQLKSEGRQFAVTASTGVAAVAIGGRTIHSFSGIGWGEKSALQLIAKMNLKVKTRLCAIQLLILDEISMISADLFDKLDHVFRLVRKNTSSFGGVQMVISGDYLQLPPFEKAAAAGAAAASASAPCPFAFESKAWRECFPVDRVIVLNTVHRQTGDDEFVRYCTVRCACVRVALCVLILIHVSCKQYVM